MKDKDCNDSEPSVKEDCNGDCENRESFCKGRRGISDNSFTQEHISEPMGVSWRDECPLAEARVAGIFTLFQTEGNRNEDFWTRIRECLAGLSRKDVECRCGKNQETLLHVTCARDPPVDVVQMLVNISSNATHSSDLNGLLPLHIACRYKASPHVVKILIAVNPAAVNSVDNFGRVPLHHVFSGYKDDFESKAVFSSIKERMLDTEDDRSVRITPSYSSTRRFVITDLVSSYTVKMTSSHEVVLLRDLTGKTPFGMFASASLRIRTSDIDGKSSARRILCILLDCMPEGNHDFFSALLRLPETLRDVALTQTHVKRVLNERTAAPLFVCSVMMDILFQILLILSFAIVTSHATTLEERFEEHEEVFIIAVSFVLSGTYYFLLRECLKMFSYCRTGHFTDWLTNLWNWLRIGNIGLVISSATLIMIFPHAFHNYQTLVVITGGMQWIAILAILRSTYIAFSVFVTGFLHVCKQLVPFVVTTLIMLGSFSFMFFIGNYDSTYCTRVRHDTDAHDGEEVTFCGPYESLLWTYTLFVGGGIDGSNFTYSSASMALSIAFGFIIIILQLNVLIAVVTDSYDEVKEKGEEVFWAERFAYLVELEAVKKTISFGLFCICERKLASLMNSLVKWWDEAIWILTGHSGRSKWKEIPLKVALILLVPLWLLLGLVTLGWLWPPQVREWLFCPIIVDNCNYGEKDDILGMEDGKQDLGIDKNTEVDTEPVSAKIEVFDAKMQQLLSEINAVFVAKMDEMHARHTAAMDEMSAKYSAVMDELNGRHSACTIELSAKHDSKIDDMTADVASLCARLINNEKQGKISSKNDWRRSSI